MKYFEAIKPFLYAVVFVFCLAFFLGSYSVLPASAYTTDYFPYNQPAFQIDEGEIIDMNEDTQHNFSFKLNATTTIDSVKLWLRGNCTTITGHPKLQLTGHFGTVYSSATEIKNNDTAQAYEFVFDPYVTAGIDWGAVHDVGMRLLVSSCGADMLPRIYGIYNNPWATSSAKIVSGALNEEIDAFPWLIVNNFDVYEDYNVEIITQDPFSGTVYVSSEYFSFDKSVECVIASSCPLWIGYADSDVGATVYLFEEDEENFANHIDTVVLQDKNIKADYLDATIRNTPTVDSYWYYIDRQAVGGIAELLGTTKVHWVLALTEEITEEDNKTLMRIKRIGIKSLNLFPLSIGMQIWRIFDGATTETAEKIDIKFGDLLAPEYEAFVGNHASSTVFSAAILKDIPFWDDLQELFVIFIYIFGGFSAFYIIVPAGRDLFTIFSGKDRSHPLDDGGITYHKIKR